MNLKLEVLNSVEHRDLVFTPQESYENTVKRLTTPLLFSEFVEASRSFPIIFSLHEGDDKLTPMAVLGINQTHGNLFVNKDGSWRENSLVPASLDNYPFYTGPMDENGHSTLVLDVNAPHFMAATKTKNSGQRLFTTSGEPTPALMGIREKILKYQRELAQTDWVVYKLYEQNLFQAKQLADLMPGAEVAKINKFFILDQQKLDALPDEYFLGLRQLGMVTNLYALIASTNNFPLLAKAAAGMDGVREFVDKKQPQPQAEKIIVQAGNKQKKAVLAAAWAGLAIASGLLSNHFISEKKHIESGLAPEIVAAQPKVDDSRFAAIAEPTMEPIPLTKTAETVLGATIKNLDSLAIANKNNLITDNEYATSQPIVEPLAVIEQPTTVGNEIDDSDALETTATSEAATASAPPELIVQDTASQPAMQPEDTATEAQQKHPAEPIKVSATYIEQTTVAATTHTQALTSNPDTDADASQDIGLVSSQTVIIEPTHIEQTTAVDSTESKKVVTLQLLDPNSEPAQFVATNTAPKKRPIIANPTDNKLNPEQSAQLNSQLSALVDGVKRNITESRLTRPQGDNALDKIGKLKKLSPDSPLVDELLNTVFERFLELAIWDKAGNASLYLARAESLFPGDPRIKEIEQLIAEQ